MTEQQPYDVLQRHFDFELRRYPDHLVAVGFVMPADLRAEDLPDPTDPAVHTRRVPAETAAALRFAGRWSRGSYEKRAARLLAALEEAGLSAAGPPRYARFDPPWTPWFMRGNEVVIPVRADGRPDDPTREGELRDG